MFHFPQFSAQLFIQTVLAVAAAFTKQLLLKFQQKSLRVKVTIFHDRQKWKSLSRNSFSFFSFFLFHISVMQEKLKRLTLMACEYLT
jgi:hypothetical protein